MRKTFRLLSAGIGLLALALLVMPPAARAQIGTGTIIEVNVPFAFHAGDAQLPAGQYRLRTPMDGDGSMMEIRGEPEGPSALFQVMNSQDRRPSTDTALWFDKYGDTYFLRKVVEEGNSSGDELPVSRSEKNLRQELSPSEHHAELLKLPAHARAS